jgi:hypothetical protein
VKTSSAVCSVCTVHSICLMPEFAIHYSYDICAYAGKIHWAYNRRDAALKTLAPLKGLEKLRPGLTVIRTRNQHWNSQHE